MVLHFKRNVLITVWETRTNQSTWMQTDQEMFDTQDKADNSPEDRVAEVPCAHAYKAQGLGCGSTG